MYYITQILFNITDIKISQFQNCFYLPYYYYLQLTDGTAFVRILHFEYENFIISCSIIVKKFNIRI